MINADNIMAAVHTAGFVVRINNYKYGLKGTDVLPAERAGKITAVILDLFARHNEKGTLFLFGQVGKHSFGPDIEIWQD